MRRTSVSTHAPIADQRSRIRQLFLSPADFYRLSEAARLIGISPGVLRREAEEDQREAYRSNGAWRFTWRQVACIALRRWTLAEIHDALGDDAATVLPPLLSLRYVTIRLPEYIIRAIETMAAEDATTIDDWLHHELIDFAGTVVDRMEEVHPGFRHACLFPGSVTGARNK
jgi:hypothetical protein